MPNKYQEIYVDLKRRIESDEFKYQTLLPSEHELTRFYHCSRNTVRRAISMLISDGYVQSLQGKGVRNIYQPIEKTAFTIGEIESFTESAKRNAYAAKTEVIHFCEISVDEELSKKTGFPPDACVYYIQRLHYLNEKPLIINHNYFLKSAVPPLNAKIASKSIYQYFEKQSDMNIINSKRIITVEKITELDKEFIDFEANDFNCMVVVSSQTYNSDGVMFEFTQSRHRPDYFSFQDNAVRKH